ncbi:MAG: RNB domain-containing ribonuclease [Rickettsiales bacterium]|nr:RNB domain-containing ribonuclease [Rickettsiales bacterium]
MAKQPKQFDSTRAEFTDRHYQEAADTGYIQQKDRLARRITDSYTIDNVPATTASDRDDAINVSKTEHGYHVEVTIADVAGHVPLASQDEKSLDHVAHSRATTIYRPWGNDPMFPEPLEKRMSLEHLRKRLGMCVHIDLDENFMPIDGSTRFEPVITRAVATDYAGAYKRIESQKSSTARDTFKLMKQVSDGLQRNFFGRTGNLDKFAKDERAYDPNTANLDENKLSIMKMVETYMLLANNRVASFFEETDLPFVYRNFDGSNVGRDGIERAYYSPDCTKHTELAKDGLKGAYCHFTSPIRRGADYFNEHMAHYAVEAIQTIENLVEARIPEDQKETLKPTIHEQLWSHAPAILNAMGHENKRGVVAALGNALHPTMHPLLSDEDYINLVTNIASNLGYKKLPVDKGTLREYCNQINAIVIAEEHFAREARRQEREEEKYARHEATAKAWQDKEQKAKNKADKDALKAELRALNKDEFTYLLESCSATGILPKRVQREAISRFKMHQYKSSDMPQLVSNGAWKEGTPLPPKMQLAYDAMQVMIVAQYPDDSRWQKLKREAIKAIKNRPSEINGIADMAMAGGYLKGQFVYGDAVIPKGVEQQLPTERDHYCAAIIGLKPDDGGLIMSAPKYSIGNDMRSASSHAIYSFLEHFAMTQLQPMRQSSMPSQLYLNMEDPDRPRKDIVTDMCRQLPNFPHPQEAVIKEADDRGFVEVKVSIALSDKEEDLIEVKAHAYAPGQGLEVAKERAFEKAYKRIARNRVFGDKLKLMDMERRHDPVEVHLQTLTQPHKELEKRVKEKGWSMETSFDDDKGRMIGSGVVRFDANVLIDRGKDGEPILAMGQGPNKDCAMSEACQNALVELGMVDPKQLTEESAPGVGGWVLDSLRDSERITTR